MAAASSSTDAGQAALQLFAIDGASILLGEGFGGSQALSVDGNGNMTIAGTLKTGGSCSVGCSPTRRVQSFGAQSASPTLEDTGEAQLDRGRAFVRFDTAFARAIDPRAGYFVLITPESQTRGLYVASRNAAGFTVRENASGESTGPFAYRVVAHPYGVRENRLAIVEMPRRAPTFRR
jgi:hypothetical protein